MRRTWRGVFLTIFLLTAIAAGSEPQQSSTIMNKDMGIAIDPPDLAYPPLARQTRTEGAVVIRVELEKNGKVKNATALSGSNVLIEASVANARKWEFQPNAQQAAIIIYNFELGDAMCLDGGGHGSVATIRFPTMVTIKACSGHLNP